MCVILLVALRRRLRRHACSRNLATTIYLHRTLAHRLDDDAPRPGLVLPAGRSGSPPGSSPASGWRCTASTTPSPTSRAIRTRPAARLGARCSSQRRRSTARSPTTPNKSTATRRTCRPTSGTGMCSTTPSLGLGIGIAFLCVVLGPVVGPRRRRVPHGHLPRAQRGSERRRPPLRAPALRQLRDEPAVARIPHRGRGPAQQPPRRADLGQARAAPARDRSWHGGSSPVFRRLGWVTIRLDKVVLARVPASRTGGLTAPWPRSQRQRSSRRLAS